MFKLKICVPNIYGRVSVLGRSVQDITKPMLDQYQHAKIDVLLHLKKKVSKNLISIHNKGCKIYFKP